jgi:hypothetical protein
MNSPDVLLRLVQPVAPPILVFSWLRFRTAPFRALSPTGLLVAIQVLCLEFLRQTRLLYERGPADYAAVVKLRPAHAREP